MRTSTRIAATVASAGLIAAAMAAPARRSSRPEGHDDRRRRAIDVSGPSRVSSTRRWLRSARSGAVVGLFVGTDIHRLRAITQRSAAWRINGSAGIATLRCYLELVAELWHCARLPRDRGVVSGDVENVDARQADHDAERRTISDRCGVDAALVTASLGHRRLDRHPVRAARHIHVNDASAAPLALRCEWGR